MSSARRSTVSLALVGLAVALASAPAAPPARPARAAKPTREQIERWVEQLGDGDFEVREQATQKLWEAGQAAETAVRKAATSDDAEVRRRANTLLAKFKWGIFPDTPREIAGLIDDYRQGDRNGKGQVVAKLLRAGSPGCQALARLVTAEEDKDTIREVRARIVVELPQALPALLEENHFDALEVLLEQSLAQEARLFAPNYAAYWFLRGKLDDRIARYKALAEKGPDPKQAAEVLTHLYKARGDADLARQAADKAGRPDLAEAILFDAGDWKSLARRPAVEVTNDAAGKVGWRITYCRLAGDKKGLEEALGDLRKHAEAADWKPKAFLYAKILLLNDRPAEALEMLARSGERPSVRFEILAGRLQFREAMAMVDKARADKAPELPALELLQARTLYGLGEKDKALAIFKRFGDEIKEGKDENWFAELVDAENRAGLRDQAFAHCARVLALSRDENWPYRFFARLFPDQTETAFRCWGVLRKRAPGDAPADALKQLRALMAGKARAKEVAPLIDAAQQDKEAGPGGTVAQRLLALAEVARACGLEAQVRSCAEKGGPPEALVLLGDLYAGKKDWDRAAEAYSRAWEKDRSQENPSGSPLPLYLSGWALAKAGQEKAGKRRMEQSHWIPLGHDYVRATFLRALAERGHTEAVRREVDLLLRLGQPGSFYVGDAQRRRALEAQARKEYLPAALGQEQSMMRCLRPGIDFIQAGAYAAVPAFVHRLRALGLVAAGKVDQALQEAALCGEDQPGAVDLPILLVPELEKRGRKKEAAALYERSLKVYEGLCKEYPRCAWAHNSAAWLSACCRRNLDRALEHARKGVELAPDNAGHLDTLAEVYFQRGDKDKAVAAQRKVVEMDPKKPYFRKQLERIEAGDPSRPRPSEDAE